MNDVEEGLVTPTMKIVHCKDCHIVLVVLEKRGVYWGSCAGL